MVLIDSEDEGAWDPNIRGADKTKNIRCFRKVVKFQIISSIESNYGITSTPLNISIEKHDVCCNAISSQHCLESVDLHMHNIQHLSRIRHVAYNVRVKTKFCHSIPGSNEEQSWVETSGKGSSNIASDTTDKNCIIRIAIKYRSTFLDFDVIEERSYQDVANRKRW